MKLPPFGEEFKKRFGKRLKELREKKEDEQGKKCTQSTLAESIGVPVDNVQNWEQGRVMPRISDLLNLCEFFNCGLDYLFGFIDCTSRDIQYIYDYTGLDEDAISKLHDIKESGLSALFNLSALILCENFEGFLLAINNYFNVSETYLVFKDSFREKLSKCEGIKKKSFTEDDLVTLAYKCLSEETGSLRDISEKFLNYRDEKSDFAFRLQSALIRLEENIDSHARVIIDNELSIDEIIEKHGGDCL